MFLFWSTTIFVLLFLALSWALCRCAAQADAAVAHAMRVRTCGFCDATWTHSTPCENGYDRESGEPYLCGYEFCPACGSCQGQTVTHAKRRAARLTREIKEGRYATCTRPAPHVCTVNGPCNGYPKGAR